MISLYHKKSHFLYRKYYIKSLHWKIIMEIQVMLCSLWCPQYYHQIMSPDKFPPEDAIIYGYLKNIISSHALVCGSHCGRLRLLSLLEGMAIIRPQHQVTHIHGHTSLFEKMRTSTSGHASQLSHFSLREAMAVVRY